MSCQPPQRLDSVCFLLPLRLLFLLLLTTAVDPPVQAEELAVYRPDRAEAKREMLRDYLRGLSHEALDARRKRIEELTTVERIREYQQRLRAGFVESLGGFPERTPLKPQVVGKLSGDGYRLEKIVFESRPNFLVTAALYLPDGPPPYPAVLLPCGHSENGKAAGAYQRASILLARNGLAVLCYDPLGQGERKQILRRDASGDPLAEGAYASTSEHMLTGIAPILLGESLATYRIWDGIRALDYLAGRADIDGERLGCTGNSGGGLMTSYLMALDQRIVAAAPGCFITTTRLKNEKPGPGDAEQNLFGQIRDGLDHPDFLIMHAPRAALICAATRDFVPIDGTWDAFRQAKRIYTRLGHSQRVNLVETDAPHGFSRRLREGATHWMRRWLLDRDEAVREPDFPVHSDAELRCTTSGQVLLEGSRSIFDVNRQRAAALRATRRRAWSERDARQRREVVRSLGIRPGEQLPPATARTLGQARRFECRVEKLVLSSEGSVELPGLLFEPPSPNGRAVLYVHGQGKRAAAVEGGPLARYLEGGDTVLAVDLRGYGETETKPWRYSSMAPTVGNNAAEFFVAYMLGRSLVAMRAEDVLTAARYLSERTGKRQVQLEATGRACVPALHAAACQPERFAGFTRRQPLMSYQSVIELPVTRDQLENTVHGALRRYDLDDLVSLYGGPVHTIDPRDAAGEPLED